MRSSSSSSSSSCLLMPTPFSLQWLIHTVTWLKGIRDVAESGRSCVEMDGDLYRFVLKKANYGDGGTYIVKASNCHGTQKAYCTVRVSYPSRSQLGNGRISFYFIFFLNAGQGSDQFFRVGLQGRGNEPQRSVRTSSQAIQQRYVNHFCPFCHISEFDESHSFFKFDFHGPERERESPLFFFFNIFVHSNSRWAKEKKEKKDQDRKPATSTCCIRRGFFSSYFL